MIAIKLKMQDNIRRIGKAPQDLKDIKEKAKAFFSIDSPIFWYIDSDQDQIYFDTQEEYSELLGLGIDPLVLNVECSNLLDLVRSTSISNILPIEPKDPLSLKKTVSLFLSKSDIISIGSTNKKEISKKTWNLKDTTCQTDQCIMIEKDAQFLSDINLDYVLQEVKALHQKKSEEVKRIFMGVECSLCKSEIYNFVFKCSKCDHFYNCRECALEKYHEHTLIKSKFMIVKGIQGNFGTRKCDEREPKSGRMEPKTTNNGFNPTRH